MEYSEIVLAHFHHLHHAGRLSVEQAATRMAELGKVEQGDVLRLYLQREHDVIVAARFEAYGSVVLFALAEFTCRWLEGKTHEEARALEPYFLLESLALSSLLIHSATLVTRVVQQALERYDE